MLPALPGGGGAARGRVAGAAPGPAPPRAAQLRARRGPPLAARAIRARTLRTYPALYSTSTILHSLRTATLR